MQTQSNAEFFLKLSQEKRDHFAQGWRKLGEETIVVLFAGPDDSGKFEGATRRFLECIEILRLHGSKEYLEWVEYNVGQVQGLTQSVVDRSWLSWGRELVPHLVEEEEVEEEFVRRLGLLEPPNEGSGSGVLSQDLQEVDVEMREEIVDAREVEPVVQDTLQDAKEKSPSPTEPVAKKRCTGEGCS
ncbi:hypothetical protein A0H81_06724 [Grifola frondosa]|uniref:Uncharacterized protein n=1 Tax=Grifola frondosa TaxID=5627 RepID=A0A1C7M9J8_GRIFR|nr:hypothetical protein A0H81_06724 [Grifola frondosa]